MCKEAGSTSASKILQCYNSSHDDNVKVKLEAMKCEKDDNICINVESTQGSKIKGCGKVEEGGKVDLKRLASKMSTVDLQSYLGDEGSQTMEIKDNACNKNTSEINRFIKKMNGLAKSVLTKELPEISEVCICSTDKCNSGFQIEAKQFQAVIFSLIISKLFMG